MFCSQREIEAKTKVSLVDMKLLCLCWSFHGVSVSVFIFLSLLHCEFYVELDKHAKKDFQTCQKIHNSSLLLFSTSLFFFSELRYIFRSTEKIKKRTFLKYLNTSLTKATIKTELSRLYYKTRNYLFLLLCTLCVSLSVWLLVWLLVWMLFKTPCLD